MAFFSVLAAVALEHLRPPRQPLPHYQQYARFIKWLEGTPKVSMQESAGIRCHLSSDFD